MRPTYKEFINELEELFGQRLTDKAEIAAKDFWEHWDILNENVKNGQIKIHVDLLMLGIKIPIREYKKHHPIKGFAKVLFLIALITFFFNWKIGLAIFIASLIVSYYGNIVKQNIIDSFINEIMINIQTSNHRDGMTKICSHYIAGTIQIEGKNGKAHWPNFPSNCITGRIEIITE